MNPPVVDFGALLPEAHVAASLEVPDKAALLAELGRQAAVALGLPADAIVAALAAREALGSTGVGAGVALPHARLPGLLAPAGFFARLQRPIDFAAIDGAGVDLVFLLLSPAPADRRHLTNLAAMARRLRRPTLLQAIRAAASAREIRTLLVETPPE